MRNFSFFHSYMTIQFSRIFSLIANPSAHEKAIRMMGSIPVIFTTRVWICISSLTQNISIFCFLQNPQKIEILFVSLLTYISNKQFKMTGIEAIVVGLVMVVGGGQLEEWLEHQNYKMAVARNRSPPPNRLRWFR